MFEDSVEKPAEKAGGRRLVFLTVAGLSSVVILTLALLLGVLGFNVRRTSIHQARLEKLLKVGAGVEQVTKGLENEGSPLLMSSRNPDQARIAARQWGKERQAEIEARASRHAEMRVFRAGDMAYFLFFDAEGKVREYVYVSW
jgi:hypothetical protein